MTSIDRDLGRLEGKVDATHEQMKEIAEKLDKILSGECATGKANTEKIQKIDTRLVKVEMTMAKAVAVGLLVAGGGHGAAELIKVWF